MYNVSPANTELLATASATLRKLAPASGLEQTRHEVAFTVPHSSRAAIPISMVLFIVFFRLLFTIGPSVFVLVNILFSYLYLVLSRMSGVR